MASALDASEAFKLLGDRVKEVAYKQLSADALAGLSFHPHSVFHGVDIIVQPGETLTDDRAKEINGNLYRVADEVLGLNGSVFQSYQDYITRVSIMGDPTYKEQYEQLMEKASVSLSKRDDALKEARNQYTNRIDPNDGNSFVQWAATNANEYNNAKKEYDGISAQVISTRGQYLGASAPQYVKHASAVDAAADMTNLTVFNMPTTLGHKPAYTLLNQEALKSKFQQWREGKGDDAIFSLRAQRSKDQEQSSSNESESKTSTGGGFSMILFGRKRNSSKEESSEESSSDISSFSSDSDIEVCFPGGLHVVEVQPGNWYQTGISNIYQNINQEKSRAELEYLNRRATVETHKEEQLAKRRQKLDAKAKEQKKNTKSIDDLTKKFKEQLKTLEARKKKAKGEEVDAVQDEIDKVLAQQEKEQEQLACEEEELAADEEKAEEQRTARLEQLAEEAQAKIDEMKSPIYKPLVFPRPVQLVLGYKPRIDITLDEKNWRKIDNALKHEVDEQSSGGWNIFGFGARTKTMKHSLDTSASSSTEDGATHRKISVPVDSEFPILLAVICQNDHLAVKDKSFES